MAFIVSGGNVISFAEYEDVTAIDQRLFEANEGFTDVIVEDALEKATARILTLIRSSDWWKNYYLRRTTSYTNIVGSTAISVPAVDANLIIDRTSDFTDLCVYYALSEYLLPKVADFGNEDTAERQKIGFYNEKFRSRFEELLNAGDWYDFDNDGSVAINEKQSSRQNLVRQR